MVKGIECQTKITYKDKNYLTFGKFVINRKKLNEENILLIKYPKSYAPVPKIRRTIITDDFKNLINDLLDTGIINIDLQKELLIDEVELLELLLTLSGLIEQLHYKRRIKTIQDYKKRYEILKGALIAGNDSTEIINELIEIIDILTKVKVISIEDSKILKDLLN